MTTHAKSKAHEITKRKTKQTEILRKLKICV